MGTYRDSDFSIERVSLTGDQQCLEWFNKVHDYTWTHFKDTEHPEWFGYLNRRGEVLLPLKGGNGKDVSMFPEDCISVGLFWRK